MSKTALITGITGQDGSFLAELLLEKGYEVHGIIRRSSSFNTGRIEHLYLDEWVRDMKNKRLLTLHYGDMTDSSSLVRIIQKVQPDEIYNLAAQSHVKVSFDCPEYTAEADAVGTLRLLEAVRILGLEKKCKIYQASTSELFGKVQEVPQKETTPFYPRSPYGVAKQYGFWIVKNYRESYGMFAVNGILFNHESERRGETFVTRKITLAAARIKQGYQDKLYLGNLDALRDWGYAKDYVECMWLIMQQEQPEDFVIATGEYHTVREFCTLAFKQVGINLRWEGEGVDEKGIDVATGKSLVEVDPRYFRPAEVEQLLGDPTKAKTLLGWNPRKTSFEDLIRIMVEHDMRFVKKLREEALFEGSHGITKGYSIGHTHTPRSHRGRSPAISQAKRQTLMSLQGIVYILTNKNNTTLYTGVTRNLRRRVAEHKLHINKGFSDRYNLEKLVYYEVYDYLVDGIHREKQLKKWRREWKEKLISDFNPTCL